MIKKNFLLGCLLFSFVMHASKKEETTRAIAACEQHNIQTVAYQFSDIDGNLKEVLRPGSFTRASVEDGLFFDGSSIPGCTSIFESDMLLVPDIETFTITRSNNYVAAHMMCDIFENEETPFAASPRNLLRSVLNEARAMGYDFLVGPEIEFFILTQKNEPIDNAHYFAHNTNKKIQFLQAQLLQELINNGIAAEKFHHEVAQSQFEVVIRYADALTMADQLLRARNVINSYLQDVGLKATFMPKPFAKQNGSGMHVHFSLYDIENDCNAFYSADNQYNLSETGRHFIAGILHHIKEITAVLNPTINSYKRLVPGYEAPTNICWAPKNRSAVIRIPEVIADRPNAIRAELRSPDSTCNPYLAFAVMLAAGLQGVQNKYTLEDEILENLYHLTASQLAGRGIDSLPESLCQALELFEKSDLICSLFGEHLMREFLHNKKSEIHRFNTAVTNWERDNYL